MSPIERLPVEIIHKIIVLVCLSLREEGEEEEEENQARIWNKLNPQREPWTLANVCALWRQAALGDHQLWCSLDFDAWHSYQYNKAASPELVACLAHSNQHLLAIRYAGGVDPSVLSLLLQSSERWEDLTLGLDIESVEPLKQVKGRLPELRKLVLRPNEDGFEDDGGDPPDGLFDIFQVAPKLQHATIHVYFEDAFTSLWIDPADLVLPWHQLTSLTTDSFDILIKCPQLVDCELRYYELPDRDDYPITLPNLRTLAVGNTHVLDVLVLPSLESLSLNHSVTHNSTRSLIARSGCTLKTLEVGKSDSVLRGPNIGQLIDGCPDLLTVVVYNRVLDDQRYRGMDTLPLPGWRLAFHSRLLNIRATYTRDFAEQV